MFLDQPISSPSLPLASTSSLPSTISPTLHSNSPSSSSPSARTTTESPIKSVERDSLPIDGIGVDRERAESHLCNITHAYHPSGRTNQKDVIEMNITVLPWQLSITKANQSLSIKWTDTTGAGRLKGSIVQINYSCCYHGVLLPPCLVFKIAGSRYYSVATDVLRQSKSTPSTAGNRLGAISSSGDSMTSIFNTSVTPGGPVEFVTSNITNSSTTDAMSAYEERLEVIVTGLCVGVAILLAFWLACFLVEKRSQSKYMKRGSDKQNVSQTRQYPHEVATVRKTLMEIYDMPMIRVAQSDEDVSESGSGQSTGSRGRNRLESEGDEQNSSTNISSSDQPTGADSSSSEDTLRKKETKKKTTFADPKVHLDVPKEGTPEKFGQWRPVAKTGLGSPGEVRSNRFTSTSPPAHPKRTLAGGRSPSILKKPSNFNANKSPPSILRFSRGRKMRDDPTTIEMNSMGDHLNHGYSSPKKQIKLVSALKTSDSRKHKRTRFKMDEPEDTSNCAGAGADALIPLGNNKTLPKQLVTCEVHFETPAAPILNGELEAEDELDDDEDEEVTERTPLKKNVNFVVVDKGLASKCKFNLSWEDTDGLPCTDV
ncbi:uncharacterized protein LOC121411209 [Lytechinus variegatus]|uniref:uncharacterized protein LOC121411209 n=1 Tax=Lytechinus variegatus TaxID=7654 RepID=UPI001BB2298E|nr:uncharacterized protein LOC121411209 [Lytechinus variegatus]